jgi:predicted dienelactone hydrolase
MRGKISSIVAALALALAFTPHFAVAADPLAAGELHRLIPDPAAAVRDGGHSPRERLTVWYPAAAGAVEQPDVIGPPARPLFDGGSAAPDAAWRDPARRYPLILMSHGFGGSARQTAWLATVLARHGYVVAAVDHPGANGLDQITLAGASLWWMRAEDLRAALAAVTSDADIAPHINAAMLGVAGFSIGGYTALTLAGAKPDPQRYVAHCQAAPDDGVCRPQKEFPQLDPRQRPQAAQELWRANPPLAPGSPGRPALAIKALFLMAPAVISGFDPSSLRAISIPTVIVLGDADTVATPRYNGLALALLLPNATADVITGVNHYDFLDLCTPAGQAVVQDYCRPAGDTLQALAHRVATERALTLFDRTLK